MGLSRRHRLAQRRKSRGFTQEELAHHLQIERSTVLRWERGDTKPQPWVRRKLAHALRVTPEQLDELLTESDTRAPAVPQTVTDQTEPDDMNRRRLLRLFSVAGTLLTIPGMASDNGEPTGGLCISAGDLDEYGQFNDQLWRVFSFAPVKSQVMPLVRQQIDVLCEALRTPHTDIIHRQLCSLTCALFQLAGEIFFDSNRYTDAAQCYTLAASAAREANDRDLWACALTRHAFIAIYEHQFTQASSLMEAAAALARQGDSTLSTRHWVAAVQAETFAGLQDLHACQRALDVAEQVRDLPGVVHNGGWLRFDDSRLPEQRGTCFVMAGRPELAEAALADALSGQLTARRRASLHTDLAKIAVHHRDLERVTFHAGNALTAARSTNSGVIASKLAGLQPHLGSLLHNRNIYELNTEITTLVGQSTAS